MPPHAVLKDNCLHKHMPWGTFAHVTHVRAFFGVALALTSRVQCLLAHGREPVRGPVTTGFVSCTEPAQSTLYPVSLSWQPRVEQAAACTHEAPCAMFAWQELMHNCSCGVCQQAAPPCLPRAVQSAVCSHPRCNVWLWIAAVRAHAWLLASASSGVLSTKAARTARCMHAALLQRPACQF
jgi:hypothetical protein